MREVTNYSIDKPDISWYTFPCSIVSLGSGESFPTSNSGQNIYLSTCQQELPLSPFRMNTCKSVSK